MTALTILLVLVLLLVVFGLLFRLQTFTSIFWAPSLVILA